MAIALAVQQLAILTTEQKIALLILIARLAVVWLAPAIQAGTVLVTATAS